MTAGLYARITEQAETPAGVGVAEVMQYQRGTKRQARNSLSHYLKRCKRLHVTRRKEDHRTCRYFVHIEHAQAWAN